MKVEEQEGDLLDKFKFHEGNYWEEVDEEVTSAVFSKLAKVLNHALAVNRETGFIRVPIWPLLHQRFKSLPPLAFNFNDLQKASFKDPDNEACRILLCLLDPGLDRPQALRLADTAKQRLKTIPPLPWLIIRLIDNFGLKGEWVEAFLLEVYPLVDRHDHDVKTPFENYFKDLLESQPSHLNDPEVQKALKL